MGVTDFAGVGADCGARRPRPRASARADRYPPSALKVLIGSTVATVFAVDDVQLQMRTRGAAKIALARQVAIYLAHTGCSLSLTEAGRMFGRDRTTAAHACRVIERRRDDQSFDRALGLLETVVRILSWPREVECSWHA